MLLVCFRLTGPVCLLGKLGSRLGPPISKGRQSCKINIIFFYNKQNKKELNDFILILLVGGSPKCSFAYRAAKCLELGLLAELLGRIKQTYIMGISKDECTRSSCGRGRKNEFEYSLKLLFVKNLHDKKTIITRPT